MRCLSISTATRYNMEKAFAYYDKRYHTIKFDDVLYIKTTDQATEFFIFPFGCVVIWGTKESHEKDIVRQLDKFTIDPPEKIASDLIFYNYSDQPKDSEENKTYINEEENKVILANSSEYIKLSISYGLAQSVKLKILENSVNNILQNTAPISKELAQTGSTSMTKKQISKQIGNLFNERYSINLHSGTLETPEFFWRRPNYEPLYLMTVEFQDITLRNNILNSRLDIIQELYNILCNEMNYKHSSRLEITIVILITIEVALALFHDNIWLDLVRLFKGH
ncbi:MAG: RMD1 family protein [Rickettsiaceae bacterium]|nr:RMD1 family protein [Rickettsiaceae bacterium]